MWKRTRGIWLAILFSIMLMMGMPLSAQEEDPPPPFRLDILGIDDRAYPNINLYTTVTDIRNGQPISNLVADDFDIIADDSTPLEVMTLDTTERDNRPVHLMLVLDLTSSISPTELNNMRSAAVALIEQLDPEDQVGVIRMDHISTALLQALSRDHNAAINAMFGADVTPVENQVGNVVTDGLYNALAAISETSPAVRPAVVMMTDVTSGSIGGQESLENVRNLAEQRGASIYILYFETENEEGLPIRDNPPADLADLANESGGLLLEREGASNTEELGDYDDDQYLINLALQVADLIAFEYRIEIQVPIPGDNEIYDLSITAAVQESTTNTENTFFRARSGTIELEFSNLSDGERVSLPLEIRVRVLNTSAPIRQIEIFRLDNNSGAEILLTTLSNASSTFLLTEDDVPSGTLSLVARAQDEGGNQGETLLTLVIDSPIPTVTSSPAPSPATPIPSITPSPVESISPDDLAATTTSLVGIPVTVSAASPTVTQTAAAPAPNIEKRSEASSNRNSLIIPVIVALVGMFGTLLVGFSLISLIQRQQQAPHKSSTERPTLPRKSAVGQLSSNAPTGNVPLSSLQQTLKMENTPDKETWEQIKAAAASIDDQSPVRGSPQGILIDHQQRHYPLYEGENTIGRHSSNMVQLLDATVSRYHAVIELFEDMATIMDWQASHATLHNGVALEKGKRQALQHGDQIQMGSTLLQFIKV